jgi:hypothetical protein
MAQQRNSMTMMEDDPKMKRLVGQVRFDRDKQQIAALLILMGLPEVIQPLAGIASLINGKEVEGVGFVTVTKGLPMSTLIGALCCVLTGIGAMAVGIGELFHNFGSKRLSTGVSIFMQTAYILTVSSCMNVTRVASKGSNFDVPIGSLQSATGEEPNAQLLAAMGVLAILAYWFGMLGSISFLLISLAKFQEGKPQERDGNYYRGRLAFYSCILLLGGLSQLVVGAHLEYTYALRGGPLPGGTLVSVAMYLIKYPSLAITVGVVQVCAVETALTCCLLVLSLPSYWIILSDLSQVLNGFWGILRQCRVFQPNDGGAFVCSVYFGWLVQLVLQIMVQPSILPGTAFLQVPPTVTAFAFGMNFMPAYLDSKANSLPAEISPEYYGLDPLPDCSEQEKPRRDSYFDEVANV